jgi:hypothetical protein
MVDQALQLSHAGVQEAFRIRRVFLGQAWPATTETATTTIPELQKPWVLIKTFAVDRPWGTRTKPKNQGWQKAASENLH